MKAKISGLLVLVVMVFLFAVGFVQSLSTAPSQPTNITEVNYSTNQYPNGTMLNGTRGYLYTIIVNESAPTYKWIGYVGEVNGFYALQDPSSKSLYDWTIVTVTGELYATREGPMLDGGTFYDWNDTARGGIPDWTQLSCANSTIITREEIILNHTASDEDSYTNTFKSADPFVNPGFFAGEKNVTDTNMSGGVGNCYGVNLHRNNADIWSVGGRNWTEVVLTDKTNQMWDSSGNMIVYDVIYAALLENNSVSYDGTTKDFQILLPQRGLPGNQQNIAYYFYIELV